MKKSLLFAGMKRHDSLLVYVVFQWLAVLVVLVGFKRWVEGATWGHSIAFALLIVAAGAMASNARKNRRREKNDGNR